VASNDPADELVGRVLGARYRVDALIARGGMARVYRAHDTRLDRDVAVKVHSRPYAESAAFTRRVKGEALTDA
jgi:serine/threonine-protein kinase